MFQRVIPPLKNPIVFIVYIVLIKTEKKTELRLLFLSLFFLRLERLSGG